MTNVGNLLEKIIDIMTIMLIMIRVDGLIVGYSFSRISLF